MPAAVKGKRRVKARGKITVLKWARSEAEAIRLQRAGWRPVSPQPTHHNAHALLMVRGPK